MNTIAMTCNIILKKEDRSGVSLPGKTTAIHALIKGDME